MVRAATHKRERQKLACDLVDLINDSVGSDFVVRCYVHPDIDQIVFRQFGEDNPVHRFVFLRLVSFSRPRRLMAPGSKSLTLPSSTCCQPASTSARSFASAVARTASYASMSRKASRTTSLAEL